MRYRVRLMASFSAILFLSLTAMLLIQAVTVQRDRQERTTNVVRDVALLRGAMEDGLVDAGVYRSWYARVFADDAWTVWLVDSIGIVGAADAVPGAEGDLSRFSDRSAIARIFSAYDIKEYLEPALRGESQIVTGDFDGRLDELSVTVIEPVVRADGSISSALFVSRRVDTSQETDVFWIFRQSGFAVLCAVAVGFLLVVMQSVRLAKPIEALAGAGAKDAGDDITRLSREMARMREQMEELEDLRKGFVSNVSHELRAPLTNVIGYLQGIVDGAVSQEQREKCTAIALEEARRMSALIGDLLNLSRIESGRFALEEERFDICEMLRRTLLASARGIEEKSIRVAVDFKEDSLFVFADPRWVRLAADNIFGNAVKFVGEGGNISLRAQKSRDRVYVTIADDGPGIAKEDAQHVFEWFYKADKSHSTGGTGLGLAIVHSIMKRHGQPVRVSSREGKGTVVTFALAAAEKPSPAQ